jgi:hypothetical protein
MNKDQGGDQLALPMTIEQRAEDRKKLQAMHPGNRFRLMFGQPLLPENNDDDNRPGRHETKAG